MSFKRPQEDGWQSRHTALLMLLLLTVNLMLHAEFVHVATAEDGTPQSAFLKMSFHMYRPVYVNSNSSILVYDGADTNPPTYSRPLTAAILCNVHQSTQFWFAAVDAWVGGISWITQPLAATMTIQGNASMTVWMSTPDPAPIASGYAFGLTEADNMGNPIGSQFYQYTYHAGSILNQLPTEHTVSFAVNRTFLEGHILAFFVIVGSTAKGWHYQAYFDSSSMNSFVQLPTASTPIPEFSGFGTVACLAFAVLCLFFVRRPRSNFNL